MSCDRWREMLDAYVDGSCSPQEISEIESHLGQCLACSSAALNLLQSKRRNREAAQRFAPTPEFRLKVEEALSKTSKRRSTYPAFGVRWVAVAASSLAFGVLFLASAFLWTSYSKNDASMTELLDLHVATVGSVNPVDVASSDRHTVKPWFQGKLPFTFNLPELQDSPYKLIGGKLIYFHHNPAAELVFELRKHELSVFIFQDRPGMMRPSLGDTSSNVNGFTVESWSKSGTRYVLVGDTNQSDVHELSELLREVAQ